MTTTAASEASTRRIPIVDYLVLQGDPHLVANVCASCGALFFDRRNACASCGTTSFEKKSLATTGTLRSFTIVSRAAPGVPVPYVSCTVALDGDGMVKANLVGVEPDPASIGLGARVRLTTFPCGVDEEGTEAVAFGFTPA
ncbi:MAG: Zn-ribbon domain-containing OB-fold protein [Acidimicrobiales bacterium]